MKDINTLVTNDIKEEILFFLKPILKEHYAQYAAEFTTIETYSDKNQDFKDSFDLMIKKQVSVPVSLHLWKSIFEKIEVTFWTDNRKNADILPEALDMSVRAVYFPILLLEYYDTHKITYTWDNETVNRFNEIFEKYKKFITIINQTIYELKSLL